ncbi:hypothetical protein [Spirulina sp. 06S082]|nr:hypothetical protein [Spirulina sp. 06S082]MEA5468951.1 hypothetical protein [Spirulina sp. 06S082]
MNFTTGILLSGWEIDQSFYVIITSESDRLFIKIRLSNYLQTLAMLNYCQ